MAAKAAARRWSDKPCLRDRRMRAGYRLQIALQPEPRVKLDRVARR
jgi:hypothetical protein